MNYSVIMEEHNEGIVVTQDGGIASFYEVDDGLFNLCLYNSHIIGFNPKSDEHWEELSNCNMYVQQYTKDNLDLFEMNNVEALTLIALNWLCVNCNSEQVEFSKLFNHNTN